MAWLTKSELQQLRNEIVLGSLYLNDYENSLGIDPDAVYMCFESFLDYCWEEAEEIGIAADDIQDIYDKYDNIEDIYTYYAYMYDEDPLPRTLESYDEGCSPRKKKSSEKKKKMLNQGCGGKRKSVTAGCHGKRSAKKEGRNDLHHYFDDLDDRFSFDLDDEFQIYVRSDLVTCYVIDTTVFGNGAGLSYTIAIPVGEKDFWQMDKWIERGLNEFFDDQTEGSDYTFGISDIDTTWSGTTIPLPDGVDDYNTYVAEVEVVPYQNIGPYGDYGIDAGVLESRRTRRSVKRESTEEIDPGDIYDIAVKTLPKEDIDHHASDLYLRKTPESTALINKMKYRNSGLLSTFRDNIDGDIWYELPFCYGFERSAAEREAELDRSVKQLKSIYGKESKRAVKKESAEDN